MGCTELRARAQPAASPLIRMATAPTLLASAGLLLLLGLSWRLAAGSDGAQATPWFQVTVAAVLVGCAALGWLRPASVGLTAPQVMLLLGAAGMVAGLWLDARSGGLAALAALCLGGPGNLWGTLALHWRELPLMHLGMVAGGLATVPLLRSLRKGCRRQFCAHLAQNLLCSSWMVTGMAGGTVAFMHLAAGSSGRGASAMLGGMFGGMVWGMVASVAIYRLWIRAAGRLSRA